MAIRNIRVDGDEILFKISKTVKEVTPRTEQLIDDMIESLELYNGVGLAAVQVGVLKRMCIINISPEDLGEEVAKEDGVDGYRNHTDGKPVVVINPEVVTIGEETQTGNEGCLSAPGKWGTVTRPMYVTLKAFDREMKPYELKAKGLLARAICHEYDHMDGKMYLSLVEGPIHDEKEEQEDDED